MATTHAAAESASKPHPHRETEEREIAKKVLGKIENEDKWLDWKQIKCVFTAGGGFTADAYDLFIISLLTALIGRVYYPDVRYYPDTYCQTIGWPNTTYHTSSGDVHHACGSKWSSQKKWLDSNLPGWTLNDALMHAPKDMPTNSDYALKSVALIGTLVGQLTFGRLGDLLGRKAMHTATMVIMIVAALCSAMSYGTNPDGVIGTLCFWRFLLGLGIGGNYPLSATVMSETATAKTRGTYVAAVFACQGLGYLIAGTVCLVLAKIWEGKEDGRDFLWRTALALGCVPPIATLWQRMLQPETERYEIMVKGDVGKVAHDVLGASEEEAKRLQVKKKPPSWGKFLGRFGWPLFGCASTWFLLDIAYYSQNMFQGDVFTIAGWLPAGATMNGVDEVYWTSRAQLIIALGSTIPGYWFTVATIEIMGRIPIQVMGFVLMTTFMGILAGMYNELKTNQVNNFIALYALTFFFSNWGPNSTTYILPSELFPARFRSSAHGFCAAWGKAGAIIGVFGFGILKDTPNQNDGLNTALWLLVATNFLGLLCTYPIPEPKGKTLEDIGEDLEDLSGMHSLAGEPSKVLGDLGTVDDVQPAPVTLSAAPPPTIGMA